MTEVPTVTRVTTCADIEHELTGYQARPDRGLTEDGIRSRHRAMVTAAHREHQSLFASTRDPQRPWMRRKSETRAALPRMRRRLEMLTGHRDTIQTLITTGGITDDAMREDLRRLEAAYTRLISSIRQDIHQLHDRP